MKRFSEIKNTKPKKYESKDSLRNDIFDILESLDIKVTGSDPEKLSNVDININGKEEIVEKLKELIDDVRLRERKTTLNVVKTNSFRNFNMNWINEQLEALENIKLLNEKIQNKDVGTAYREELKSYFVSNLNGESIEGWEFGYEYPGIFNFSNNGITVMATPFHESDDKVPIDAYNSSDLGTEIDSVELNYNIEQILYNKYRELISNYLDDINDKQVSE